MLPRSHGLIDQTTDTSLAVIRKFASLLTDTEFGSTVWDIAQDNLKTSSHEKLAGSRRYAFPEAMLFPVGTENDAILSKVYFEGQRTKIAEDLASKINYRLNTYLDLYAVPDSFEMQSEKVAEHQDFKARCLLPSAGMFKVATVHELNKAYSTFDSNLHDFSLAERVEFSKEFAKVATTIRSQELPDVVQRYCGVMDSDIDNVRSLLHVRKVAAVREGKTGQEYEKLAASLADIEDPSKEELEKLAGVIHDIDEAYGFTQPKYDRKMPDAYSLVFNKQASTTEEKSKEEDPEQLSKADVIARFGEDALESLEDEEGKLDSNKLSVLLKNTSRTESK